MVTIKGIKLISDDASFATSVTYPLLKTFIPFREKGIFSLLSFSLPGTFLLETDEIEFKKNMTDENEVVRLQIVLNNVCSFTAIFLCKTEPEKEAVKSVQREIKQQKQPKTQLSAQEKLMKTIDLLSTNSLLYFLVDMNDLTNKENKELIYSAFFETQNQVFFLSPSLQEDKSLKKAKAKSPFALENFISLCSIAFSMSFLLSCCSSSMSVPFLFIAFLFSGILTFVVFLFSLYWPKKSSIKQTKEKRITRAFFTLVGCLIGVVVYLIFSVKIFPSKQTSLSGVSLAVATGVFFSSFFASLFPRKIRA
jgi:hypothetical protein